MSTTAFQITSDGSPIDSTFQVLSIDVWTAVNAVPRARIVISDGDLGERTFAISSQDVFLPGKRVAISAGDDGQLTTIFAGVVVRHAIEVTSDAGAQLIVDVADAAITMTVARNTVVSGTVTDIDIISALIAAHGLQSDVTPTTTQHEAVVPDDATDWDTVLARAGMNGLTVTIEAGKVSVKPPDTSQPPVLRVAYGESIIDLRAEMDVLSQPPVGAGALAQPEVRSWTSAMLHRPPMARLQGHVRFQGSALARAGAMIELEGLSDRFNGTAFVRAVHHDLREGHWLTTADFGLPPRSSIEAAPPLRQRVAPFDDTNKIITIKTPGNRVLTLNDETGTISITDSHNNVVTLEKSGVTIGSASDLTIKASGNLTIKAKGNLSIEAAGDATCKGVNVDLIAGARLSAKGSASAELKSPGIVTVEGSLVKIN